MTRWSEGKERVLETTAKRKGLVIDGGGRMDGGGKERVCSLLVVHWRAGDAMTSCMMVLLGWWEVGGGGGGGEAGRMRRSGGDLEQRDGTGQEARSEGGDWRWRARGGPGRRNNDEAR